MDIESRRDLELLQAVEQNAHVTQRTLASKLGIALGLTNIYLRRLVRKGYIKCVTIPPNRLKYLITPRGFARKAKLTYGFMQYSLDLVRDSRREWHRRLQSRLTGGDRLVALYGTGEAAELAYLSMRELGLELVAVFSDQPGGQFLGMPIQSVVDHDHAHYDLLIVTSLAEADVVASRLARDGVPRAKIMTLDSPERPG